MQAIANPQLSTDVSAARTSRPADRRALRITDTAARLLLGLAFFVFGLDGFLHFFPVPDPSEIPPGAAALGGAMAASGYMLQLVKGTEVLVGVLLLVNRFVPLALTLLAPVTVNILAFHGVLAPEGLPLPIVLTALQLFLAWRRRDAFAGLLRAKEAR